MFNSKSLFLSLIIFLSFFFSEAVYGYDNLEIKVIGNKIIASTKIREVESWWPKVSYKIVDKELWETEFPGLGESEKIIGPTEEINNKIYFAYSSYLMEFDLISAKFTDRFYLAGDVLDLNSEEDKISFIMASSSSELPKKIKIEPNKLKKILNKSLLPDYSEKQTKIKIWDAQRFSRNISQNIYITDLINDRYSQDILQIIKENYLEAVKIDLTNPWYYIYLGLISEKLGRSIYANVYFQKALEIKSLVFFDFFQLSSFFEYIGKRKLADKAFENGVQDFIIRGYYPEQLISVSVIINYFPWLIESINNLKDRDPERVFVIIERFNKIAPFKEGNYNILNSFSKYLIEQGKLLEAKEWKLKALEVRGYLFSGDYSIILADVFLNLFIACMLSSVLFIFSIITWHLKCLREYKKIFPQKRNYFFRRFYKKSQIFSLFLLYLFSLLCLSGFCHGINTYGVITNSPEVGKKGSWGNEETNEYFRKNLNNNISGNSFRAIANIQAQNFPQAKEILEKIKTPEAYNNLGVIYFLEDKKDQARLAFETAIEKNKYLIEAIYNLSLINDPLKTPKRNEKINFFRKYSPETPLLVFPNQSDYRNAYYQDYTFSRFSPYNIGLFNHFFNYEQNEENSKIFADNFIFIYLIKNLHFIFTIYTFLLIIFLVGILVKITEVNSLNNLNISRLSGLFIPGIYQNWLYFGPLIFSIWLGSGITILFFFINNLITKNPAAGILTKLCVPEYTLLSPLKSFEIPYGTEVGFTAIAIFSVISIFNFFAVISYRNQAN